MMYICAWHCVAVQPRDIDLFEDRGRRADRQARAAVFRRDQRRQIAACGQVVDERGRILGALVEAAPVFARIFRADAPHRVAQLGIVLAERERNGLAVP